jgi:cell fate regulator YaaT (PSP1 superfamily)
MPRFHLVRVGALGGVGHFWSADAMRYPRATRVVTRTPRGLEVGEVIAPPSFDSQAEADGSIVRGMTVEDHLLAARLDQNRQAAYEACRLRLAELGAATTLLAVEYLFDGQTIVFYFLGPQPPEIDAFTGELAEAYEAQAQIRAFADSLTHGCGPGCGTDEAAGGCGSCATGCAVAGLCATRKT